MPQTETTVPDSPSAGFTAGNIVVCRVGSGAAPLTSAAVEVFLDEYTPLGSLVSSLALPTTASGVNDPLVLSGSQTGECQITRSANNMYIIVPGYGSVVGAGTVSTSSAPRIIARVDANGTIDTTSSTTSFGSSVFRGAASQDGTGFWVVAASGGVVYVALGGLTAGTVVSTSMTNNRFVNIFNGQLYAAGTASSLRLGTVGSGLPTTTGNTITNLTGISALASTPTGFFFADLDAGVAGNDTLYIADEGTATGVNGGGLKKFSLVGSTWTYNGTFPASAAPAIPATAFHGLTGSVSGSTVTLFATRLTASPTQLISIVDSTGYNAAPTSMPTLLATASANTAFRGVALAPVLAPTVANVSLAGRVLTAGGEGLKSATVTLQGGNLTTPIRVITGPFGYYKFDNLPAGLTYILTVRSKRYSFENPTRVINLDTEFLDADFIAQ